MRRELSIYKYLYGPLSLRHWIPKFRYSKNVQGWWFIRNFTLCFIRWAITLTITIQSDFKVERGMAHDINVQKYMK